MTTETLTVAYADPPYIGKSKKHYKDHPDYAGEVDHGDLLDRLIADYPDGWALSLHVPSLGVLLGMCEQRGLSLMGGDIRVLSWVKTFGAYKRNVRVAYVWEPIIVKTPRRLDGSVPTRDFVFDDEGDVLVEQIDRLWRSAGDLGGDIETQYDAKGEIDRILGGGGDVLAEPITMRRGLSGAKPERFCFWLFNCLGLRPCDTFHDLFPGTGAVTDAWGSWCAQGGPKIKQSVRVENEMVAA